MEMRENGQVLSVQHPGERKMLMGGNMKLKNATKVILTVMALTGLLLTAITAEAKTRDPSELYTGLGVDECTVSSQYWGTVRGSRKLALGVALTLANTNDPRMQLCQETILLNVKRINIRQPIVIGKGGVGNFDDRNIPAESFVLEGVSDAVSRVVLDVGQIQAKDWDRDCAITIPEGKDAAYLKNITLDGVPSDKNGICINSSNNVLDDVYVKGGLNGIVFGERAKYNVILPNSKIEGAAEASIKILNTAASHGNRFLPTNQLAAGDTDADGFQPLEGLQSIEEMLFADSETTGSEEMNFDMDIDENVMMVDSVSNQSVQLWQVVKTGGSIFIRGAVVDGAADDCTASIVKDVKRLQVYTINQTNDGFYGYVSGYNSTVKRGILADGTANGTFMFNFPANGSQIAIVPELSGYGVGKISKIIKAVDDRDSADCKGRIVGLNSGGASSGGSASNRPMMKSTYECIQARNLAYMGGTGGTPLDGEYDSDGDNIIDNDEDANANCRCDEDETCWWKVDTDEDGVPDGVERDNGADLDTDGDGIVNMLDSDSDNDGVKDGAEDRNVYITTTTSGGTNHSQSFLYKFSSQFSRFPVASKEHDGPVTCNLGSDDSIGVRYAWYEKKPGKDPVLYTGDAFEDDEEVTADIDILICRNQTLNSPLNFNGKYDSENAEMDFRVIDTDDDGWCDGTGSACTLANGIEHGAGTEADACPLIQNEPEGQNSCRMQLKCVNKEQMFYTVDARYVVWDEEGNPLHLRDTGIEKASDEDGEETEELAGDGSIGGDGIPDVFQVKGGYEEVARLCGDTDKDGIPDCVENPLGSCSGVCGSTVVTTSQDPIGLRHYCGDTDGDTLVDGFKGGDNSDVCPVTMVEGGDDSFSENGGNYSCGTGEQFYQQRKILSFFLDRDNDGIRDGVEDNNQDGIYNNIVKGVAGIGVTESDPMSKDSDEDGISDKLEINGWTMMTNPSDIDTDGDGLTDADEDRNGDFNIDIAEGLDGQGCQDGMLDSAGERRDTDPTLADTDGDTLSDKLELDGKDWGYENFLNLIADPSIWSEGGIEHMSSPLAKDSDGDGLDDNEEYNGQYILYSGSNPCLPDSDGDTIEDGSPDELAGCRLNPSPTCKGGEDAAPGVDSDSDGLSDLCESILGTRPDMDDTDLDGIKDGEEDANQDCVYSPSENESNPLVADTDGDGLTDGYEKKLGTIPTNIDSDGDCIPDGPMMVTDSQGNQVMSRGEDANQNGEFDMGSETDPRVADTDGDGLPDGWLASSGLGEDLNCNGVRDTDEEGRFLETDPRNPDSDMDGFSDYDEMLDGGFFNIANVGRASSGGEGCSLVSGTAPANPSLFILLGMALAATSTMRRRMKKMRK